MDPTPTPNEPIRFFDRRSAIQWMTVILGGLASAALGVPIVGYFLGAILKDDRDYWIDLGPIDQFPQRETRHHSFENKPRHSPEKAPPAWDGATRYSVAYVRRLAGEEFQVFAVNCAHLGCPVSWFPQSGLFMCPCHGGVYYEDGSHASGPPPRGLFQYPHRVVYGRLEIKGGHYPTLYNTFKKGEA